MRIIKFRGKLINTRNHEHDGEWTYGYLVNTEYGLCIAGDKSLAHVDGSEWNFDCNTVDPDTVGQFIGKIKTGDDIYENDLIQHGETIRIVEIRNGNTCITRQDKSASILLSFSENPKKLGNIFDNPELLK